MIALLLLAACFTAEEQAAIDAKRLTSRIRGPFHPAPDVTCWMAEAPPGGPPALSCYPTPKESPDAR